MPSKLPKLKIIHSLPKRIKPLPNMRKSGTALFRMNYVSKKSSWRILHEVKTHDCTFYYRALLCIRGTSHGPVSVSVCLCLSVTSRCSTKTAKRRITQTTLHDSPGTLVFWSQIYPRNSTGVTPYEGAEYRWGGKNRRLSTNNRLYLENGTR